MSGEAEYRLPRTVMPSHYDISIVPDLEDASFTGTVGIDVDVAEATSSVVLNAIELKIENARVTVGEVEYEASILYDEDQERVTLTLTSELPVGSARIDVSFTGILNDDLRGFYRSVYTADDGVEKTIATTQFEATDARRAFPCWDQPDFKATYAVTLTVDDGLMAVSNAAEVSRMKLESGKVEVTFAETMKMSTYLVAFVVGELEATDPVDVDGTPLRIIAPPGNMHLTSFALDVGAHALRFFSEYYDIPYPGDKLDMVAIPDFSFGAMENLGCITYRETALLLNEERATQAEAERVADVIAHEIAHMWFGDLVTMKWWNGIWLNEAFATFAEIKCVEAYRPEWKRWLAFAPSRALSQETDALNATRPVELTVASPEEANAMFDVLTYQKGSSVLRMLEQYLGEEEFRAGVTKYLKTHAYANTDTPDLWKALEDESGKPVGEIMDTWIFQGGFPRVTVSAEDGGYRISQEQFRYLGQGDQTWSIPVLYRSGDGEGSVILGDEPVFIEAGENIVVNAGGEGFYRVLYEGNLEHDVGRRLANSDPLERFAVVSDTLANVLAGDAMGADFLSLVSNMTAEDELDVWAVAIGGLSELDKVVSPDDREAMREFVVGFVSEKAEELGWEPHDDDSDRTKALRGLLLRTLGILGNDRETIEEARSLYSDGVDVDAEVADAALMITAANGTVDDFAELIELSDGASDPQMSIKYLRAATSIPDPAATEKMITMILDGDIRSQDAFWVLARLIGNRDTGAMAWEMITENWEPILASMPVLNVRRMLDLVQHRSEPEVAASIMRWLEVHPIESGEKHLAQKMEQLQVRVALREREGHRMGEALRAASFDTAG
ncbi:MAG: M1 family metallopeptidase [Actinomycetia bacterium]|nr:M1 family metallopeptidase [Actinomycetes bacterium]